MSIDRYVKIVLTVIALELFWIGLSSVAPAVSAQAPQAVTPVIIRGIELSGANAGFLPVTVVGSFRQIPDASRPTIRPLAAEITATGPLRIYEVRPLKVEIDRPLVVKTERPLQVENVGYTATPTPR